MEGQLHDEKGRRIGHMADRSGHFIEHINRKIEDHRTQLADLDTFCMEDADIAIIAYGSVARPAMNAIKLARGIKDHRLRAKLNMFRDFFKKGAPAVIHTDYSHLKVGLIKINTVWPFPQEALKKAARDISLAIVPEMNVGKYVREIERALDGIKVISMPKCGGDIHTPKELLDEILEEVGKDESALSEIY